MRSMIYVLLAAGFSPAAHGQATFPRPIGEPIVEVPMHNPTKRIAEIELTLYPHRVDGLVNLEEPSPFQPIRVVLAPGERKLFRAAAGATSVIRSCQLKPKAAPCEIVDAWKTGSSIIVK